MLENLIDILTLIAQLDIALISISIAAYAIAVSYFGKETSKILWSVKARRRQLEDLEKIARKSRRRAHQQQIEAELSQIADRERKLMGKFRWLTFKRSVVLSSTLFIYSLLISALGISFRGELPNRISMVLLVFSISNVTMGLICILKTLDAIQFFAFQFPLPRLWVGFLKEEDIDRTALKRVLGGEQRELRFEVLNHGEDIAENLDIFVFLHPDFKVLPKKGYKVVKQGIRHDYPGYTGVIFEHDLIHVNESFNFRCFVKTPKKEETYEVPVRIYEKKIGYSSYDLTLEVA